MNDLRNYSAAAHQLYNQEIPIKVYKRTHDIHDTSLQFHSHDYMELAIVTGGSATHSIVLPNQEPHNYRVKKGNFFLINMNEKHSFIFKKNEYLILENILFDPSMLKYINLNEMDSRLSFIDNYYFSLQLPLNLRFDNAFLTNNQMNIISALVDNLKIECNNTDKGHSAKQILLLMVILAYTQSQLTQQLEKDNPDYKSTSILRLISYLQHHFSDNLTLDDLCKVALCGKRHLTRQFKKITNETIVEYVTRLRVNKACIMLANTDLSITDISFKVGYQNSSFFGKRFKAQTGYSPTEYREQIVSQADAPINPVMMYPEEI